MEISWLKLDVNILDDEKIKLIRSYPDGNSIIVLWIGILCLAMKSSRPGIIELSDGLPYSVEDLANLFNIERKTVELGLALFTKYKMVELFDGGCIEVINFAKHQKIETIQRNRELSKIRMRNYRERLRIGDASVTRNDVTVTSQIKDKDTDKENTPSHEPQKPVAQKSSKGWIYPESFLMFWSAYPKKVGKDAAYGAWRQRNGSLPDLESLLAAVEAQKNSPNWKKDGGQFIPHPATWIRQGRWADEVDVKGDGAW